MLIRLPAFRRPIYYAICFSLAIVGVLASLAALCHRVAFAQALLAGGSAWFFAMLYTAWRLFHRLEWHAVTFIKIFFRTEVIKLMLSAGLFILFIKLLSLSIIGMSVGYVVAQFSLMGSLAVMEV